MAGMLTWVRSIPTLICEINAFAAPYTEISFVSHSSPCMLAKLVVFPSAMATDAEKNVFQAVPHGRTFPFFGFLFVPTNDEGALIRSKARGWDVGCFTFPFALQADCSELVHRTCLPFTRRHFIVGWASQEMGMWEDLRVMVEPLVIKLATWREWLWYGVRKRFNTVQRTGRTGKPSSFSSRASKVEELLLRESLRAENMPDGLSYVRLIHVYLPIACWQSEKRESTVSCSSPCPFFA